VKSRSLLILLTSLNLLDYLDRYLVAALGSLVKAELHLSDKAFGFLGTAFFLVYLLTAPVFGWLGDRYGRVRLMAAGAVLWSVATSFTAWVATYPALLLTRGLVGVGEASYGTLAPALIADRLPWEKRSPALGIFYLAIPVGSALAYLVGGFIGSRWGWRPAFLLGGIPSLILAFLLLRKPWEAIPRAQSNPETAAPGGNPWTTARELWRLPTFKRVTLGYGMITFALGGMAFWMPRFLEVVKGLTLAQANYLLFGSVAVAGALGTMVGGFLGGSLLARTPCAPLWVSMLGAAAAVPLAAMVILAQSPVFYVPALVGAIFLLFLNPGVLTGVIVSVAGPTRRAQAVALNIVVIHLVGDVPSPVLIGWISDVAGLTLGVSLTLGALVLAAILFLTALPYLCDDLNEA
jgi:MFS family permease